MTEISHHDSWQTVSSAFETETDYRTRLWSNNDNYICVSRHHLKSFIDGGNSSNVGMLSTGVRQHVQDHVNQIQSHRFVSLKPLKIPIPNIVALIMSARTRIIQKLLAIYRKSFVIFPPVGEWRNYNENLSSFSSSLSIGSTPAPGLSSADFRDQRVPRTVCAFWGSELYQSYNERFKMPKTRSPS